MARTKQRTRLQDLLVTSGDGIRGEDSTTAGVAGSSVPITAGDNPVVSATGDGGSVVLTAGSVTDGGSSGNAGSILLTPGTAAGSGADGVVGVGGSSALEFTEAASVPGPAIAAGEGRIWVRSDTPNVLVFTDDAGTDTVLGASGASTLQEAYGGGNTITTNADDGPFDVSGTEAISLDGSAASNFTVTGADLTLSTTTSGNVVALSAGDVDVDGTNVTVDATSGISLDAAATSNFSTSSGDISITNTDNTTSGNVTVTASGIGDATLTTTTLVGPGTPGNAIVSTANAAGVGNVQITAGNNTGPGGPGGEVIITAGSISGGGDAGDVSKVTITGGEDAGGGTGGGRVLITGGAATAGSSDGGSVAIDGGTSSGGNLGDVRIGGVGAYDVNMTATNGVNVTGPVVNRVNTVTDQDGATAPGVQVSQTSYFDFENGTSEGNISLNFNTGYTSDTGTNTFQVSVVSCSTTTTDTISAFTNNGAAMNPTATTVGAATFSAGDLVLVTGGNQDRRNNGIYEVVSHASNTLTLAASPTAGAEFVHQQVATTTGDSAPVCLVTVAVQRVNASGQHQITEAISNTGSISYVELGVMQEISLTVAGVAKTSAGAIAAGLPNGGMVGTHGENITSGIQYLEFGDSTEEDIGFAWDIVLPTSYSGNGLTVEFWIAGDGSASAAANMTGQFERQETGFSIAAASWGAAQSATGDTIPLTANETVKATIVFTDAQIDGLLAGEGARFSIMRLQGDTYAGAVRMTKGRIYETL